MPRSFLELDGLELDRAASSRTGGLVACLRGCEADGDQLFVRCAVPGIGEIGRNAVALELLEEGGVALGHQRAPGRAATAHDGVIAHEAHGAVVRRQRDGHRDVAILPDRVEHLEAGFRGNDDLAAIFAYLQTIPAVKNKVPAPRAPVAATASITGG